MEQEHICHECGMVVHNPAEFHPYAYCVMFKQLRDGEKVRMFGEFIATHHPINKAKKRDKLSGA